MKLTHAFAALACALTTPLWAATPASGELTDTSGPLTFTGGPFVIPNVSPFAHSDGTPLICDAMTAQATLCDQFVFNVNIPDKYRKDDKNKKQVVQVLLSFKAAADPLTAQADFDLYLFDAAGTEIGDSASGGNPEVITLPLSTLKDGAYTVQAFPFLPLGGTYTGEVRLGRGSKSAAFSITPQVVAAGETVTFDARTLSASTPSGGYRFKFGDGQSATSADGVITHTYAADGTYLGQVSFTDPAGTKGTVTAAQPVAVDSSASSALESAGKSGSGLTLGAFGLPALLSLLGPALARRRRS